jgi:penicillin-binding protein A
VKAFSAERRRRLTHRALPALVALAVTSAGAGMVVGAQRDSGAERTARAFAQAWQRQEYRQMYRRLDAASRRAHSLADFRSAYGQAAATATLVRLEAGDPSGRSDGAVVVPIVLHTRVFGRVRAELRLPVHDGQVTWGPLLAFPGLRPGEALTRRSRPARRATLLSRDGKVLARGQVGRRSSPLEAIAGSIAGTLAPQETDEERRALYAHGFPRDWPVGQSGLEEAFEERLSGRPGGELLAGARVLARARPRSTGSSSRTPTASTAAAASARASPTRATRCSRRSG